MKVALPITKVPSVTSPRLNRPDSVKIEVPLTLYNSLALTTSLPEVDKPNTEAIFDVSMLEPAVIDTPSVLENILKNPSSSEISTSEKAVEIRLLRSANVSSSLIWMVAFAPSRYRANVPDEMFTSDNFVFISALLATEPSF